MASSHARVGSINVLLQTEIGPAVRGLNIFSSHVQKTGATVSRTVGGIDRTVAGLNRSLGAINTRGMTSVTLSALRARTALDQLRNVALAVGVAIGGLMPAAIAANMIRTVDAAHRLSNQLRTVTDGAADLRRTQDALFEVAQRTRSSFEGAITIYARTARATETLGLSQEKLLRITETVQKAFAVGGATAAEAQGAAIQLSQGIASNRFSGEEFRSVAENAPVLLMGMAKALGVNIGQLREMAHAGQLTAAVVTKAILDASAEIDESFERTTSTIEQAWVRVGNAVTKYAMDSTKASMGQQALVSGLNTLAQNIDVLVSALVGLGAVMAGAFFGRGVRGMQRWVLSVRDARLETLAFARASHQAAQAHLAAKVQEWRQSYVAMNLALQQGTLSAKQLERQQKHLAASQLSLAAAARGVKTAHQGLAAAQADATRRAIAMATAGRVLQSAWGFVGGGFGAALLAITGVITAFSMRSGYAAERMQKLSDELDALGIKAASAEEGLDKAAKRLEDLASDERRERVRRLSDELERMMGPKSLLSNFSPTEEDWRNFDFLSDRIRANIDLAKMLKLEPVDVQALQQMDALIQKLKNGEASAADVMKELDKIATTELSGPVDKLIASLRDAFGWAARLAAGLEAVEITTTPKEGRIPGGRMAQAQREMEEQREFLARIGWDNVFDFPKEKKQRAPRKTAEDRFDTSIQAVYDRIAALKLEQETMSATYYEQVKREEMLRLEQEALRHAREEARRKGETDWQNAQISAEQRDRIREVAEALALQADATRRAQEEMEFTRDVLKDAFSGMREALADGKLSWEEMGDIALRVLDKIINKIEDDLINALLRSTQFGGGGGLFGGLFSLLGGGGSGLNFFPPAPGGLFDSGGVHLGSRIVSFGPKTRAFGNAVLADSGLGSRHYPAVLEYGEHVLTQAMADRTMNVISGLASTVEKLKSGAGGTSTDVRVWVDQDGNWQAAVERISARTATQVSRSAVAGYDKHRKKLYQEGARFG